MEFFIIKMKKINTLNGYKLNLIAQKFKTGGLTILRGNAIGR